MNLPLMNFTVALLKACRKYGTTGSAPHTVILSKFGHGFPSAALGFAHRPQPKPIKVGSGESGELFFAFAFLFTASVYCEGGEKVVLAANKQLQVETEKLMQIEENLLKLKTPLLI